MLKSRKFWCYNVCNDFNISEEIFNAYKQKGRFFEDASYFYESLIGTGPHPSLKNKSGAAESPILSFNNILVDINTIKIIFYLFPTSKITTLKFCNNNFNIKTLECLINYLLTKPNNIYNFTYEWNDKISIDGNLFSYKDLLTNEFDKKENEKEYLILKKSQEILTNLITKVPNRLEALCLRGDLLGDETAIKIFNGLKNELNYLRILNLFKNELTDNCIKVLGETMLVNRRLEEINLGNNHLTDVSMNIIKSNFGKFEMSETDLEEYKKLEKERQDIIKQNTKLKSSKKQELEVPFIDEMRNINGVNYRIKNDVLKLFSLSQNNFTEKSFDDLIGILDGLSDVMITVDNKTYNQEQKNILNDVNNPKNYANRIYLLK
jgi:hypothetical protein